MFLVDTLGRAVVRPCPTRLERMSEVVRHVSLTQPPYSEAVMQHSDITVPTVTRQPGERPEVFRERKRAERHRMHMEDVELRDKLNRHAVLTVSAVADALWRGQR